MSIKFKVYHVCLLLRALHIFHQGHQLFRQPLFPGDHHDDLDDDGGDDNDNRDHDGDGDDNYYDDDD